VVGEEEQCDDGAENNDVAPDACRTDCRSAYCGDEVVDSGEECDEGTANSDSLPGGCRTGCRLARCGDSVIDPGEVCDDGNAEPGDGCDADCQVEPHWDCQGVPSACQCQPYFHGEQCKQCVVYATADASATAIEPDGRSWDTAYGELQAAVDRAAAQPPGCEVWAAAGTYRVFDFSPLNTLRLATGVSLYGGFTGTETTREERDPRAHETVIEGVEEAAPNRAVIHVVTAVAVVDVVVSGFTIRGGVADGDLSDQHGGGLYVYGSSLRLTDCLIEGNAALARGGGLYSYGSHLRLERCALEGNAAAEGAGFHSHDSTVEAASVLFAGNSATGDGGGAYHGTQDLVSYNGCTVADNAAASGAGLFVHAEASVTLRNSIVWQNGLQPDDGVAGSPELAFSDVQGSSAWPGLSVLHVDPLFVGADRYELQAGSPVIDQGDDQSAPPTDLLDRPRHDVPGQGEAGILTDLGCYEHQP